MTIAPEVPGLAERASVAAESAHKKLTSPWASLAAIVIAVLWTVPTIGLFISSFRPEEDVKTSGWWTFFTDPEVTLANYKEVLTGSDTSFSTYFVNSIVITIPSVVIPITIAVMAAYAFAWMKFPGRNILFVAVFAMQIVPIQVTMIPLLSLYVTPRSGSRHSPARTHRAAASGPSGSRTRSSRCRWRSTCCTTSCARSRPSWSRRPAWTVPATCGSSPGSCCR